MKKNHVMNTEFIEKIRPFITSDDKLVREFIAQTLVDYPFVPEEYVKEKVERVLEGKEEAVHAGFHLQKHELGRETAELIVQAVIQGKKVDLNLLQLISPESAMKYKKDLRSVLPEGLWELYDIIVHGDEEKVWEEYGSYLAKLDTENPYNPESYRRAKLLAKRIAEKGWVDDFEFKVVLNENLNSDWFTFAGIFVVYMIGIQGKKEYLPLLKGLFAREEEDFLLEETADVLIGWQSDEAVEAVLPYARQGSVYAASVLGGTKSPRAVQELKDLYYSLEDMDKELIFEELAHQLSHECLPEIADFMERGYDAYMVEKELDAYSFYKLLNLTHPKLAHWKRQAEEQGKADQMLVLEEELEQTLQTEKIGRNDPCPCGSGKKYKKCCGK
ncbi:YecA family protein [Peribacillus kribbensis]|uniref:YecA family protein n=1 Tax=Peribacillus kribbensis TaxID=356658 RepID=UPI0003FD8458|nr:SEC-C metal-binding domain-containing protein [Peribacillus kribbensis]